jgi:hypothetical protein
MSIYISSRLFIGNLIDPLAKRIYLTKIIMA